MGEEAAIVVLDLPSRHNKEGSSAVSRLYRRYWADICKYVNSTFGSGPPDPEDVAQTAFTNFAGLPDPEAVENPRAFLYRSAHNIVVSHHRKAVTRHRYVAEQQKSDQSLERTDIHPERMLVSKERLALFETVMMRLPLRRRRIFVMHRFDGLTYAEIARQMNLSQPVVKRHVVKALDQFMTALRDAEIVDDEQ